MMMWSIIKMTLIVVLVSSSQPKPLHKEFEKKDGIDNIKNWLFDKYKSCGEGKTETQIIIVVSPFIPYPCFSRSMPYFRFKCYGPEYTHIGLLLDGKNIKMDDVQYEKIIFHTTGKTIHFDFGTMDEVLKQFMNARGKEWTAALSITLRNKFVMTNDAKSIVTNVINTFGNDIMNSGPLTCAVNTARVLIAAGNQHDLFGEMTKSHQFKDVPGIMWRFRSMAGMPRLFKSNYPKSQLPFKVAKKAYNNRLKIMKKSYQIVKSASKVAKKAYNNRLKIMKKSYQIARSNRYMIFLVILSFILILLFRRQS